MGNFTLHTEGKKYWIVVGPHSEGGKSGKVLALIEESEARIKAGKNKQKQQKFHLLRCSLLPTWNVTKCSSHNAKPLPKTM